jgi:hypothetical protein
LILRNPLEKTEQSLRKGFEIAHIGAPSTKIPFPEK